MYTKFSYINTKPTVLSSNHLLNLLNPRAVDARLATRSKQLNESIQALDDGFHGNFLEECRNNVLYGCRNEGNNSLSINPGSITHLETALYIHNSYDVFHSRNTAYDCSYQNRQIRAHLKKRWPYAHNACVEQGRIHNIIHSSRFEGSEISRHHRRYTFIICWHNDWLNYWHWHFDCLVRIIILKDYLKLLGSSLKDVTCIVIGKELNKAQLLTLGLVGIDLSTIEYKHAAIHAENVIHVNSPLPSSYSPYLVRRLREDLTAHCANPKTRIFVRRGINAINKRTIINDKELEEQLRLIGFSSYEMSGEKPMTQQRIFSGAGLAIGGHGSAMTNMLYMQEGSTIIELCSKSYKPDHDLVLGLCCGISVVMASKLSNEDTNGNFSINSTKLTKLLEKAII